MQVKGTIKLIKETQVLSDKFQKREFVVTTEEQYPQDILIQVIQDKCNLLNMYKVGQQVEVSVNLRGREWTAQDGSVRYFNTVEGWRIVNLEEGTQPQQQQEQPSSVAPEGMNDLPF